MQKIRAIVLVSSFVAGFYLGAPQPAQAAAPLAGIDWSAVMPPAPSKRVIEVVDGIVPTAWHVGSAVNWLDRYTASDMRLVSRCSGRAYRCVTIREGKVRGALVGWSSGSVITIDTGKAAGSKYRGWYRHDSKRTWLMIHELGHQHGLGHSSGRDVMNPYVNRYKMILTTGQKRVLRSR